MCKGKKASKQALDKGMHAQYLAEQIFIGGKPEIVLGVSSFSQKTHL